MSGKCRGCGFACWIGGDICCQYILITGKRRLCPPGALCTARRTAAQVQREYGDALKAELRTAYPGPSRREHNSYYPATAARDWT